MFGGVVYLRFNEKFVNLKDGLELVSTAQAAGLPPLLNASSEDVGGAGASGAGASGGGGGGGASGGGGGGAV